MKKFVALVLGLALAAMIPAASLAQGKARRDEETVLSVRQILAQTRVPRQVAGRLAERGARFLGYRETKVTFVYTGEAVVATQSTTTSVGPDFESKAETKVHAPGVRPLAGQKADFTMTMWLFEWRNTDGTYTEQAVVNGHWSSTEYTWIDDPNDVIDVRWIVGDLVYLASYPYDGVQRDQHTQGIASFTVNDQVRDWDLFVNFRPVSPSVYGRWTNVFANYTHTWWGVRLQVTLGAGPTGSTGSIQINTDAKSWTEGTGLAFQVGSEQSRGPVTTGLR